MTIQPFYLKVEHPVYLERPPAILERKGCINGLCLKKTKPQFLFIIFACLIQIQKVYESKCFWGAADHV